MFIRSERLFLRPGWAEDMADVVAAIGDETVVRSLAHEPWPYCPIHPGDQARKAGLHPHFLVTLPGADGARLIGCAAFAMSEGETEVGVFTAPTHRKQGYATEALRSLLSLARTLGHRQIIARPFADQAAWRRVLGKASFRPTGKVRERFNPMTGLTEPALVHALDLAVAGNWDGPGDPDGMKRAA